MLQPSSTIATAVLMPKRNDSPIIHKVQCKHANTGSAVVSFASTAVESIACAGIESPAQAMIVVVNRVNMERLAPATRSSGEALPRCTSHNLEVVTCGAVQSSTGCLLVCELDLHPMECWCIA
jgi:hypothetical protein